MIRPAELFAYVSPLNPLRLSLPQLGGVAIGLAAVVVLARLLAGTKGEAAGGDETIAADSSVPEHLLARQAFSLDKVPAKLDAIVVGSGIGGLSAAAILAKEGRRVLVLEQHDVAGGCTHTFTEGGYEFDVGLHYVGDKIGGKTSPTPGRMLFDYVTDGAVEWVELDEFYDAIFCGEGMDREEFLVCQNMKKYKQDLYNAFPDDTKAIDEYFELMREVQKSTMPSFYLTRALPPVVGKLLGPILFRSKLKLLFANTKEILFDITRNEKLAGMLAYSYGDFGERPARLAFAMQASVALHFSGGAFYPLGGPSTIARAAIRVIERAGGKVLVKAPVTSILVSPHGRAFGVEVMGEKLQAPVIVSDVGAYNTYRNLIPCEHQHRLQRQLESLENENITAEMAGLNLFVGFKGDAEEMKLPRRNLWLFPSWDHDLNCERFRADWSAPFPAVFISFPSAKDPSYSVRFPGHQVALVLSDVPYEAFERFENRGKEYENIKQVFKDRLIRCLLKEFPQLEDKIEVAELGTPLTFDHYLRSHRGAFLGLAHTPQRFKCDCLSSPRTPIHSLYLSGQDAFSAGIAGALGGGAVCAGAICPKFLWRNILATFVPKKSTIHPKLQKQKSDAIIDWSHGVFGGTGA